MPKVVLDELTQLSGNEGAAITLINENFADLADAIENTLSRDGTSPNEMDANLDLNDNNILNVGSLDAETVNAGALLINGEAIGGAVALDDLSDVDITDVPIAGDVLKWNSNTNRWVQAPANINQLFGVEITSPGNGDVLRYDGGNDIWVNGNPAETQNLNDLTDVFISGEVDGSILGFGGATWTNQGPAVHFTCIIGDETTPITAGLNKYRFSVPYRFRCTDIYASVNLVQASGDVITLDIRRNGSTILDDPVVIPNTDFDNVDGPPFSFLTGEATWDARSYMTIDITQCDAATAACGLKVNFIGYHRPA